MTIGIGFAAISKNLEINGNANLGINEPGFSVAFVEKTDSVAGCEVSDNVSSIVINQSDASVATFTVNGLKAENDTVVGTFVVKNTSTSNYLAVLANPVVTMGTANAYTSYISVTAAFNDGAKTTLAKGETTTFTVTVKLLKVINEASAQVTFQVITRATSALPTA
jgi:hypothetical protein